MLHPTEKLLAGLPRIVVKDSAVAALAHGAPLLRPGIVSIPDDLSNGQNVLVTSIKGEAVCFVKVNTTVRTSPRWRKVKSLAHHC